MKKITIILLLISSLISANFKSNPQFLERGDTVLATDGVFAILSNPATLDFVDTNNSIKIEFFDYSIHSTNDGLKFIKELSTSNNTQKTSNLMNKNIGKILSFNTINFSSFYQSCQNYNWLIGFSQAIDINLIPHSGFGYKRAMESFIDKYDIFLTNLTLKNQNFSYGINLKMVKKYQTIHNYSISEIIENDSINDYVDNQYTKTLIRTNFDLGTIYHISNDTKIAFSFLNILDNGFKELGGDTRTANFSFSSNYKQILFSLDYIDIFQKQNNSNSMDSFKINIDKGFLNNKLKIGSGIINQRLKFMANYKFHIWQLDLNSGFSSYASKEFNGKKNQKYQLSLSLIW